MFNHDLLIYAAHVAFWAAFGITRRVVTLQAPKQHNAPGELATITEIAQFSRAAVGVHMVAFAILYIGLGRAVIPQRVPIWFSGQRLVGFSIIVSGAVLACWAVAFFRSWRFRAKIDLGHQLATEGPFRLMRHPIYMGLNLLTLGTAIWVPTLALWIAVVLMIIGSELRARTEERLLLQVFGNAYTDYCARTSRFIPGFY